MPPKFGSLRFSVRVKAHVFCGRANVIAFLPPVSAVQVLTQDRPFPWFSLCFLLQSDLGVYISASFV